MARAYRRFIQVIIDGVVEVQNPLVISFDLKKESTSSPNEGVVTVYNLSESTETLIRERGKAIQVIAGYEGSTASLLNGQIRRVERDRESLNRLTRIQVSGNITQLTDSIFSRSYAGEVPVRNIVADALATFGIPNGPLDAIPTSETVFDFAWSNRTSDALDRLLKPIGLRWFEDDGVVYIAGSNIQSVLGVTVLNAETGLIGTPSITDEGLKAVSVLNPALTVGSVVRIESQSLDDAANGDSQSARAGESVGYYKINQVVQRGDNWDGEFVTEFLASEFDGEPR